MNVGSLFSGIGGLDLGLERAGMRVVWQCESNPCARAVLRKHWPSVPCYEDVRNLGARFLAPVDLICGGFPCQPFSSAGRGRRKGVADTRWLWPEMRRVVSESRPAWVLGENVTHFDGAGLEQMVSDLEALGYEVSPPFEIPACAFGLDHWRPRLWILGYSDHEGQPILSIDAEMARLSGAGSGANDDGEANGFSAWVANRLLGNAVVPQVAEYIGRCILRVSAANAAQPPEEAFKELK